MYRTVKFIFAIVFFLVSETVLWAAGGPPNIGSDMEKLGMRLYKEALC